jgi:adenine-specific DNA methylase
VSASLRSVPALVGAVPTPPRIARFLAEWAIPRGDYRVLEPSCGSGSILEAAVERIASFGKLGRVPSNVIGVEVDRQTAESTGSRLRARFGLSPRIHVGGFLETLLTQSLGSFDAVVGNPPFARFGELPDSEQESAFTFMRSTGWTPSRGMNSWVPFLVGGCSMLRPGGRLGLVLPLDLLQVNYARSVRQYLAEVFGTVEIVTFRRLAFPGVLQDVLLVLGVKGGGPSLGFREYASPSTLTSRKGFGSDPVRLSSGTADKWLGFLLTSEQRGALVAATSNPAVSRLGDLAAVDVGVVTGENDFFVLTKEEARQLDAGHFVRRILTRTRSLAGTRFTHADWDAIEHGQLPSRLLGLTPASELSCPLEAYIAEGQLRGLHRQFKCSQRDPWYSVPSVWAPDAFLSRQVGMAPRLAVNDAGVTCTDTILRLSLTPGTDGPSLAQHFVNSLTYTWAELAGRSYGGGALELMPSEAELLPLPEPTGRLPTGVASDLEALLRAGDIESALDIGDHAFLEAQVGLTPSETKTLRECWRRLSGRRATLGG